MLPDSTLTEAEALPAACRAKGARLATTESRTGGMIAAALTAITGSSDGFDRGLAPHSNAANTKAIGVPNPLIETHASVRSAAVPHAFAMIRDAL